MEADQTARYIAQKEKAINKVIYDMQLDYHKDKASKDVRSWVSEHMPGLPEYAVQELADIQDQKVNRKFANSKLSSQDTVALFITVRPSDTLAIGAFDLLQTAHKICKLSKGVTESYYTIEQSGMSMEEAGKGIHIHCLIRLNKGEQSAEPGKQYRRIENLCKQYQTTTTHYLQVKKVSLAKYQDKINYLLGYKLSAEKLQKVEVDKEWRQEIGAQEIYMLGMQVGEKEKTLTPLAESTPPPSPQLSPPSPRKGIIPDERDNIRNREEELAKYRDTRYKKFINNAEHTTRRSYQGQPPPPPLPRPQNDY